MSPLSTEAFKNLFDELKQFSTTHDAHGITRLAYTNEDEQAHHFLIELLKTLGFVVRRDAIGNVFARIEGLEPHLAAVATGSHIDSVPNGGAYDGIVGVLAGIYALSQFKPKSLKRSVELIIFRAEESSRFGFACMGSKILSGKINNKQWAHIQDNNGNTFFSALQQQGYQPQKIQEAILPAHSLHAFLEIHIEQGKVLENLNKPIGIVTGIAAPCRYRIELTGCADHSGATPMSQRQDALVAAAELIQHIHFSANREAKYQTVGTVGKIEVYPNAMNVIPGQAVLFVDIRGIDSKSMQRVVEDMHNCLTTLSKQADIQVNVTELANDQPVLMHPLIIQQLEEIAQQQDVKYELMMSGAGHDAMYMAQLCPTGMIFIPSQSGISHHPKEYSHFEHILLAANLLKQTIAVFANQP